MNQFSVNGPLRAAAYINPPLFNPCLAISLANCSDRPGLHYEFLLTMSLVLNFTFNLTLVERFVDVNPDQQLAGMLLRDEIDLPANLMTIKDVNKGLAFSSPISYSESVIITRAVNETASKFIVLLPFSPVVWFCFIGCIPLMIGVLTFMSGVFHFGEETVRKKESTSQFSHFKAESTSHTSSTVNAVRDVRIDMSGQPGKPRLYDLTKRHILKNRETNHPNRSRYLRTAKSLGNHLAHNWWTVINGMFKPVPRERSDAHSSTRMVWFVWQFCKMILLALYNQSLVNFLLTSKHPVDKVSSISSLMEGLEGGTIRGVTVGYENFFPDGSDDNYYVEWVFRRPDRTPLRLPSVEAVVKAVALDKRQILAYVGNRDEILYAAQQQNLIAKIYVSEAKSMGQSVASQVYKAYMFRSSFPWRKAFSVSSSAIISSGYQAKLYAKYMMEPAGMLANITLGLGPGVEQPNANENTDFTTDVQDRKQIAPQQISLQAVGSILFLVVGGASFALVALAVELCKEYLWVPWWKRRKKGAASGDDMV